MPYPSKVVGQWRTVGGESCIIALCLDQLLSELSLQHWSRSVMVGQHRIIDNTVGTTKTYAIDGAGIIEHQGCDVIVFYAWHEKTETNADVAYVPVSAQPLIIT